MQTQAATTASQAIKHTSTVVYTVACTEHCNMSMRHVTPCKCVAYDSPPSLQGMPELLGTTVLSNCNDRRHVTWVCRAL